MKEALKKIRETLEGKGELFITLTTDGKFNIRGIIYDGTITRISDFTDQGDISTSISDGRCFFDKDCDTAEELEYTLKQMPELIIKHGIVHPKRDFGYRTGNFMLRFRDENRFYYMYMSKPEEITKARHRGDLFITPVPEDVVDIIESYGGTVDDAAAFYNPAIDDFYGIIILVDFNIGYCIMKDIAEYKLADGSFTKKDATEFLNLGQA